MSVVTVTEPAGFKPSGKSAVLFVASFHEACKPGGQMDSVFAHLAKAHEQQIKFYKIDAEEQSDLTEEFSVEVVPTVLLLNDRKITEKVEGAHPAKVRQNVLKSPTEN
jgi:thioredoxin-like negative regulator of GroEL